MNKIAISIVTLLMFLLVFLLLEYPKYGELKDRKLHMYFLDIGQGDSTLIKTPSGKLVLVDAGPSSRINELLSSELPVSANKIDLVIVSHSHADHIGGLDDVLENYQVGCIVYDMRDEAISETEELLRSQIELRKIQVVAAPDDCFSDEEVNLSLFTPQNPDEKNENLESNIVLVDYKNFEAVLLGDAEIPVQTELLPQISGDIEVLKSAHHGSHNGFYPDLFAKLLPDFAVLSLGKDNRYGHPHKEVLDGYAKLGLKYGRTDLEGTIEVETDGEIWKIL